MSKKSAIIVLSVCLLIITVCIGGLFAFKGKKIPVLGKVITIPFVEKASAEVFNSALGQLPSIKKGHLNLTAQISSQNKETENQNINQNQNYNINSSNYGNYQIEDIGVNLGLGEANLKETVENTLGTLKFNLNLGFDFDLEETAKKSKFNLSGNLEFSGINYELALEMISTAETTYLKATKLPATPFINLSEYTNQWISYDMSEFQDDLSEISFLTDQEQALGQSWQDFFGDAYQEYSFLQVGNRLPDESIGGTTCYHYELAFDKQKLKEFMNKSNELAAQAVNANLSNTKSYDTIINQLEEDYSFEVWIGKGDFLPYKLMFTNTNAAFENLEVEIKINIELSKLNQPVSIEIPQATKTLDEVWDEITGDFSLGSDQDIYGESDLTGSDRQIRSDLSVYRVALVLYSDDYNGKYPINTNNGEPDILNITIYENYLKSYLFEPPRSDLVDYFYITNNEQSYWIIYAKLSNNQYYYFDEKGAFGQMETLPTVSLMDVTNTNSSVNTSLTNLSNDSDNDGLTDMEEIIYGTDKDNPDTDGDGYTDGEEVEGGFNPNGSGKLDSDGDGLTDEDEEKYGTDKDDPDTDGDGFLDGEEVLNGFNPNGEGKFIII